MAETEIQTLKLSPSGNNITYTLYKDGFELNSSSISINDGVFTMPVGNISDIGTYVLKAENAGGLTFHNFTVNVTCEIFIIFLLTSPHQKNQLDAYGEACLNRTLNKTEYIKRTLNKVPVYEIFVNLTCINHKPVNSEHKILSQGGSILTGFTVLTTQQTRYTWIQTLDNN